MGLPFGGGDLSAQPSRGKAKRQHLWFINVSGRFKEGGGVGAAEDILIPAE